MRGRSCGGLALAAWCMVKAVRSAACTGMRGLKPAVEERRCCWLGRGPCPGLARLLDKGATRSAVLPCVGLHATVRPRWPELECGTRLGPLSMAAGVLVA